MEISLKLNIDTVKSVPYLYKSKTVSSSGFKVNKVSCRVKEMGTKQERANFYELLSLNSKENVGFEEIKKAYRSKALEYHPDVCPPSNREESTRKFVEIRKAYDTLSDPASRQMYDYEMSLVDSFGGSYLYEGKRDGFSKKVWERQLSGLRKRSLDKSEKKNSFAL
ncbi:hypothetical protein DCAR_0101000 [Daucus carota subsp. sativus]|uniref:J domain-containing protein n=1 Tax=Daucus carota subsp. sativus TaxID=79200 RepID=A0A166G3Q6_DAUCS|nr:PREDICTED: chaperone protein dnaJ 20, chloroplastic-like [Daucus carota subsp. sativus]WOG81846.1 hypothetical protein DCAR_0101000 [Daucus carota subsp. sativus]